MDSIFQSVPPGPSSRRDIIDTRLLLVAALLLVPGAVEAQEAPPQVAPPADTSTTVSREVSPRGAFLRALAVPGWGHAAIGAGSRGAFYVGAEGGTAWMLLRTRSRLRDARRIRDLREANVRKRLADEGITDPVMIDAQLEVDEGVADARGLVESRKQQFEDWTAIGVFLVFLSGADAYVSAHLQDFPGPVQLDVRSRPDGGVDVGARVPVGR